MQRILSFSLNTILALAPILATPVVGQDRVRSPFRYVIVLNEVEGSRAMIVLLDRKAFTEANLEELLRLLLKRFPEPKAFFIQVRVSLDDIETPEEQDQIHMADGPDKLRSEHPTAYLARDGFGTEWIQYSMNPRKYEDKKIVLKGKPKW